MLSDFPIVVERPVNWGDMDAFRHVNNTVYFRWFEHARLALFEATGIIESMQATGAGPILAHTSCRFRRAVAWPDTVRIGVRVEDLGDDRFTTIYRVVSESLGDVAAEGDGRIVWFDYANNCKAPIPDPISAALGAL